MKRETQIEGFENRTLRRKIWTYEKQSNRRLEIII
jgi:hypothetical protein